jgi:hypothetical protein
VEKPSANTRMKNLLLALGAVLTLGSPAALAASGDGVLIAGIGYTEPQMQSYALHYKLVGARESSLFPDPYIGYLPYGVWADDPDFKNHEIGKVVVKRLKPGNYEFYTFGITSPTTMLGGVHLEPRQSFSIPFTIKPGEATYVGDFTFIGPLPAPAIVLQASDWGAGGYIVLSDQHERDIPIAQKRDPKLGPVTVEVVDATALGAPLVRAKEGP